MSQPARAIPMNAQRPSITSQPEDAEARVGDSWGFAVRATPYDAVTYQWRKDGESMTNNPTAGAYILVLNPLSSEDAGGYDVVVTNGGRSVTSRVARLTLLPPPELTLQRAVSFGQTRQVTVSFSDSISESSATNLENFELRGDVVLVGAARHFRHKDMVVLTYDAIGISKPTEVLVRTAQSIRGVNLTGPTNTMVERGPALPSEAYQRVHGFQDDFSSPVRNPRWVARGRSGRNTPALIDSFQQTNGVMRIMGDAHDPVHLLYEEPGYNKTNQEVLVRMSYHPPDKLGYQQVPFGSDEMRAGPSVGVRYVGISGSGDYLGLNLHIRNWGVADNTPFGVQFLSDWQAWSRGTPVSWRVHEWYWLRLRLKPSSQPGAPDAFAKFWAADGTTPEPATWITWNYWPSASGVDTVVGGFGAHEVDQGYAGLGGPTRTDLLRWFQADYFLLKAEGLPEIEVTPELPKAPAIDWSQSRVPVAPNGTAVLMPLLTGEWPMQFSWWKDGQLIPGQTNVSLTISNASPSSTGAFQLAAANLLGGITSAPVAVVLQSVPLFTQNPTAATLIAGTNARLSAVAIGKGPMSFQWYQDGVKIPAETFSSLNLASVSGSNGGEYVVEAMNDLGRARSASARIEVLVPPLLRQGPGPQTVSLGGSVRFSAEATGTPPLFYEWLRDGVSLNAPSDPSLLFQDVKGSDAGIISVRVKNAQGSVTSDSALLRVVEPLRFIQQPQGATLPMAQDSPLSLRVEVAGSEPMALQWRFCGRDIPNATNRTYSVDQASLADAGLYTAVVLNEAGATTSDPADVKFGAPDRPGGDAFSQAVLLDDPQGLVGGSNETATREAGEPLHAAQPGRRSVWYRWTAPQNGVLTVRTLGSAFDTLLAVYTGDQVGALTEIASNDDAPSARGFTSELTFSATRGVGYMLALDAMGDKGGKYVLSWDFSPGDLGVPSITEQPASQTLPAGSGVELRVGAIRADSIGWRFNGRLLAGATSNSLTLPALSADQVGIYIAEVRGGGRIIYSHEAVVEIGPQPAVHSRDKLADWEGVPSPGALGALSPAGSAFAPQALLVSEGSVVSHWVNNEAYTTQLGEQNHGDKLVRRTGWLPVVVDRDGYLVITTTNSSIQPAMAIYDAADTTRALANGVGSALVLPSAQAHRPYWFVFGSDGQASGAVLLVCIAGVPPPRSSSEAKVAVRPSADGQSVTLAAPPMGGVIPAPRYSWLRNGVLIQGANGAELYVTAAEAAATGRYTVVADNGVGLARYEAEMSEITMPLAAMYGSAGISGGAFHFRLLGTTGQRVRVQAGRSVGGQWESLDELWLPAGGIEYTDSRAGGRSTGFYQPSEVALGLTAQVDYADGSRSWEISGGRLGGTFVIETTTDDVSWSPVRTNRVAEALYRHWVPADFRGRLRVQTAH